jgi:hypothetical protein
MCIARVLILGIPCTPPFAACDGAVWRGLTRAYARGRVLLHGFYMHKRHITPEYTSCRALDPNAY